MTEEATDKFEDDEQSVVATVNGDDIDIMTFPKFSGNMPESIRISWEAFEMIRNLTEAYKQGG